MICYVEQHYVHTAHEVEGSSNEQSIIIIRRGGQSRAKAKDDGSAKGRGFSAIGTRAASGADATAHAGRDHGTGTPGGAGTPAAAKYRARPHLVDDPVGSAGQ